MGRSQSLSIKTFYLSKGQAPPGCAYAPVPRHLTMAGDQSLRILNAVLWVYNPILKNDDVNKILDQIRKGQYNFRNGCSSATVQNNVCDLRMAEGDFKPELSPKKTDSIQSLSIH